MIEKCWNKIQYHVFSIQCRGQMLYSNDSESISTGILAMLIFYVWFDDGKFRNKASNIMTVIHNHLMFRWIKITRNSTFLLKEKIVLCFRSCIFSQDIWLWEDMTESRGHPDPSMIGSIQDQKVKDSQFWWFAFRGGKIIW